MKKRLIPILLILAVAAGIVGYRHWEKKRAALNGKALLLYGNVDIRRVDLAFRVAGRIAEVPCQEGDPIHRGDLVARLDPQPIEQDLAVYAASRDAAVAQLDRLRNGARPQEILQARAQVELRKASLRTLELEYERIEKLVRDKVIDQQTFDNVAARRDEARAQLRVAEETLALAIEGSRQEDIAAARAQLASAEAALARARTRLEDTRLLAPHDGILLTRVQEPGAVVGEGQPVVTLSLLDPVWVRAYVSEPDLGRIRPGMPAEIVTDSRPGQPYRGHVGFISPEAEFTPKNVETPRLRTDLVYRLRVIADNPDGGLRQGMPVTVRIDIAAPPAADARSSSTLARP